MRINKGEKFKKCVTACQAKNTTRNPTRCRNPFAICTDQAKLDRRKKEG